MMLDTARSKGDHGVPPMSGPSTSPTLAQPFDPAAGDATNISMGDDTRSTPSDIQRQPSGVDRFV